MPTWTVGSIEITRVEDPGFELVLPQDDATRAALQRSPWLRPHFVEDDWSLRIGSSATIVATGGQVVLVDPFLAFDQLGTLGERLTALREAGLEADDVDLVVNTHYDQTGVNLLADGSPAFPRARYLFPHAELDAMQAGIHEDTEALVDLWRAGGIEPTDGDEVLGAGLRLADAPGHNPGHHVLWIEDGDASTVVVGHLFLHPAQIADPTVTTGDHDPEMLVATRRALLAECADRSSLLIGPLFAPPGAGTVEPAGETWRLTV